jgi:hypothetical protein
VRPLPPGVANHPDVGHRQHRGAEKADPFATGTTRKDNKISAGDLTPREAITDQIRAWRIVLTHVRGPVEPEAATVAARVAFDEVLAPLRDLAISDVDHLLDHWEFVFEVLAQTIADDLVAAHGREGAERRVETRIAALLKNYE